MTLSTRDLAPLGDLERVRRVVRAQAVLTALLSPVRPEIRFLARPEGVDLAGWDTGQGDDLLLVFAPEGALIRGFDHESPLSPYEDEVAFAGLSDSALEELSEAEERALREECRPLPGILDELPPSLRERLLALDQDPQRPVAIPSVLTFCVWRTPADPAWRVGSQIKFPPEHEDPDGSAYLLRLLDGGPEVYQAWAQENFGGPLDLSAVEAIYAGRPLSAELVESLAPSLSLGEALALIAPTGYGAASG